MNWRFALTQAKAILGVYEGYSIDERISLAQRPAGIAGDIELLRVLAHRFRRLGYDATATEIEGYAAELEPLLAITTPRGEA